MVTFNHADAGTPQSVWDESGWRESVQMLAWENVTRVVVVAAHPDDETLGAGGLIARAAELGLTVSVVVASNGEASHPESSTHTPARLAAIRRQEVITAVEELAPAAPVRLLGLPDGGVAEHEEELAALLTAEVGDAAASTWIVAPWRSDGHPDHAAVGRASATAALTTGATLWEYPVWAWHWSTPTDEIWDPKRLRVLELSSRTRFAKSRAMTAHTSQINPLSDESGDEAIIQPHFGAYFERPFELFVGPTMAPATIAAGGKSLNVAFFDRFYSGAADPWGFETRWYERRKRALTLAALPRERYSSALELGCSIGVLTEQLALRCDSVLATDISERPLETARERLSGRAGVTFRQLAFPGEWPDGEFDLVVLSEVGYYCSEADLTRLVERCRSALAPGGVLVACHWRHPVTEYPGSGESVHAALAGASDLVRTVHHRERDFLLEVFEPLPALSVAQREGLVP